MSLRFQQLFPTQYPPFTRTSHAFWQRHGAVIAALLRPETPLSLAEVVTAYGEYLLENPERGIVTDETYVAWVLLKLAEFGLVRIITHAPHPTLLTGPRPQYILSGHP